MPMRYTILMAILVYEKDQLTQLNPTNIQCICRKTTLSSFIITSWWSLLLHSTLKSPGKKVQFWVNREWLKVSRWCLPKNYFVQVTTIWPTKMAYQNILSYSTCKLWMHRNTHRYFIYCAIIKIFGALLCSKTKEKK